MTRGAPPVPVSILILTLNEESNIGTCLDHLRDFDDVVVLDSGSTDRTAEIARSRGARVLTRPFDDWSSHQNWALREIEWRHPWVFYLDADEHMTHALRDEIRSIASDAARPEAAFYCGRRNYFMGKWIRHAMPPGAIMRFFRPDRLRFERLAHPIPVIDGQHGYLREMFDHYTFSKGMTDWFAKHNGYSHFEAIEGMRLLESRRYGWRSLFARDRYERRMALKELSFRLPFRPLTKFLWMYVLRRGFLDGHAGFVYCRLQAIYEYMIVVKIAALKRNARGVPT